jgi:hypothetical protein
LITVEAIRSSLRVYQDGALVFDVADSSFTKGSIGLYCRSNNGARFIDVRLDDFSTNAPVVYRFKFTTSKYSNFFRQMHSFQDETWKASLIAQADATTIASLVDQAIDLSSTTTPSSSSSSSPADSEIRAYESLKQLVDQTAILQNPPEVQVTRIVHNNDKKNKSIAL